MKKGQQDTPNRTLWTKQAVSVVYIPKLKVLLIFGSLFAGGNLNAASRQALMQKLARTEQPELLPEPVSVNDLSVPLMDPDLFLFLVRDRIFLSLCKHARSY